MTCQPWQEAISAVADGEAAGVEERLLESHLARCPLCRRFQADVNQSARAGRVRPAEAMPDLAPRVVKLNATADRASHWGPIRAALALVALLIVGLSLPALLLGDEAATSAHAARHLGAFSAAYGVGLLVVAVRPAKARAMLPVAQVLAGALLVGAVVDILNGNIPLTGESTHLPELASVALIWLLAIPAPRRKPAAGQTESLRLVEDPEGTADDPGHEAV